MCLYPIKIKIPSSTAALTGNKSGYIEVPCGWCSECKAQYQSDISTRMYEEYKSNHYKAVFFTLTYNDDSIPRNFLYSDGRLEKTPTDYFYSSIGQKGKHHKLGQRFEQFLTGDDVNIFYSVRKEDVQNAIKRFRKNSGLKFKYFVTSEYGTKPYQRTESGELGYRPHYHGVFFGVDKEDCREFFNDWRKHFGMVKVDNVTSEGAFRYISKYCSKGSYENKLCSKIRVFSSGKEFNARCYWYNIEHYGVDMPLADRTFHLSSKFLGISYLTPEKIKYHLGGLINYVKDKLIRNEERIKNRKYVDSQGKERHLPRYYREKIFSRAIQHQMSDTLRERDKEVFNIKYGELEANHEYGTIVQMDSQEAIQRQAEREERVQRAYEKNNRWYNRSKL